MIEINLITILKDGFLISINNPIKSDNKIKQYLLVFKLMRNHKIAREIGFRTKKGKRSIWEDLKLEEDFTRETIYNEFYYDISRSKNRLDEANFGFIFYKATHTSEEKKEINDTDIRKKVIQSFIQGETLNGKFNYWLGNFDEITIKFELDKSVTDYNVPPPKEKEVKENIQTTSIFSDEFKQYVRFESKTEGLNNSILSSNKGFGVQDVDKLNNYLPRRNYDSKITKLIQSGKNILIQGQPDAGKTRTVYEVLKNIKGYYVFS